MAQENTPGPQQDTTRAARASKNTNAADNVSNANSINNVNNAKAPLTTPQPAPQAPRAPSTSIATKKGHSKTSANKPAIGGTAVPGAKSTSPRPAPTTNSPNQQQAESYNRDMRRRMQRLGTGPYSEDKRMESMQERRKKRIERRKQIVEEQREHLRKSVPGGKITLGRRTTYFLIGVVVLLVLLIVVFVLLRQFHVIG